MSTSPGPSEQPPTAPEPSEPAAPASPTSSQPGEPASTRGFDRSVGAAALVCSFAGLAAVYLTGTIAHTDGPGRYDSHLILLPRVWPGTARYTLGLLAWGAFGLALSAAILRRHWLIGASIPCFLIAITWGLLLAAPHVRRGELPGILFCTLLMLTFGTWATRLLRKHPPAADARPPSNSHRTP